MKKIIWYLIIWLIVVITLSALHKIIELPKWYIENLLLAQCTMIGALGGILYCLRGVYLSHCAGNGWDDKWSVWYYLRPLTSSISGFVSCIFLKAGLLALEAAQNTEATLYGYLAIAFIAGYNVDNFMKKLESIAQTVWGIGKSRASDIEVSEEKKKEEGAKKSDKG
ncbi:MAG: hypothetical protein ACTSW1_19070 [Candidatus Hodarchaeales archaeon]